jgi:hypothetical protein
MGARRTRIRLIFSGLTGLGLVANGADARAREPAPESFEPSRGDLGDGRTLGGHTFQRPVFDDSAFLPTSVGFRQGFFYANAGTVKAQGLDKPVAMAAAVESLDVTVAFLDWLAISATGDLQAVVGASEVALYSNASSFGAGARFGPVARVLHLESTGTQIALRPYYQGTFGAILDVSHVLPSVRERIENESAALPSNAGQAAGRATALENDLLSASVIPLRRSAWGGSLHVAQAMTPYFGVQLSYDLRRERFLAAPYDLVARKRSEVYLVSVTHTVTASLTFDASRLHVPLGLSLEATLAAGTLASDADQVSVAYDTTVLFGPGLWYTGRKSLQLGVFVGGQWGQSPYSTFYGPSDKPSTVYGQFTLRHYF